MSPAEWIETDPLIADSVLTEYGRFEEWLAERGPLLPSDEAMLASQWALIERSVFEVTDVRLDQGLTLRDVRTGDVIDVTERRGTHGMKTGTYVLARPLPVGGDTLQFFGGLTIVPDSMLHVFIDPLDSGPSAVQLRALVAEAESPPELRNTSGDELVFVEMTWRVDEPTTAIDILDATFERQHDGTTTESDPTNRGPAVNDSSYTSRWVWLTEFTTANAEEGSSTDGDVETGTGIGTEREVEAGVDIASVFGRTVVGDIVLDADRLTITTNSTELAERAAAMIAAILPDAVLLEDLRSSMDDIREDEAYGEYVIGDDVRTDDDLLDTGVIDPTQAPPELQAIRRDQMNLYEERWVDDPIPALGGATPRQALAGPTRRQDLLRLLDHMEDMESQLPGDRAGQGMRTARLRELLGL